MGKSFIKNLNIKKEKMIYVKYIIKSFMKKLLKKNQVVVYVIALMLVVAGYLNFTTNNEQALETSLQMESDDMQIADIGDAKLANSNNFVTGSAENQEKREDDGKSQNSAGNVIQENSIEKTEENTNNENVTKENATVQTNGVTAKETSDYFVKSKLERDKMYSQMLETYENVLNSSNSLETQKQSASEEIKKINEIKNSIMVCENLISTKGFNNNIVFVNGESISIIIGSEQELTKEQVAQIQNIISRELKANIENIHISQKKL